MNWIDYLNSEVYQRLCNCRTIKTDLPYLVNAKWRVYIELGKDKKGFTKEDALVSVLEHLDCNSQYFDLSREEYDDLCKL